MLKCSRCNKEYDVVRVYGSEPYVCQRCELIEVIQAEEKAIERHKKLLQKMDIEALQKTTKLKLCEGCGHVLQTRDGKNFYCSNIKCDTIYKSNNLQSKEE